MKFSMEIMLLSRKYSAVDIAILILQCINNTKLGLKTILFQKKNFHYINNWILSKAKNFHVVVFQAISQVGKPGKLVLLVHV